VPLADGTLNAAPVEEDSPLIPSLLTLSDVYGTGYHAAIKASVSPRTSVTVIGDGAVGLLAVLSARQLGAEQIILMGRHTARTDLGREFGATHVVAERGDDGIQKVRDLTGGDGTHVVIEAVGHMPAYEQAVGVVRPGGVISRVGVPQYDNAPVGFASLFGPNITLTGGPAPEQDAALATTPADELLSLPMLQPDQVTDTLHAYQLAKRGNALRVMAEAVRWGRRGARVNTISPGIIITPLARDELTGPRGEGYRRMIELSPARRAGTPDEVGTVGALLMGPDGAFITGSDFLMDGGVTASYFFGELAPK
jgi:hypothetical protein